MRSSAIRRAPRISARAATPGSLTLTATGSGNVSVYGRIPAGQAVPAGTYTDTVVITLDF